MNENDAPLPDVIITRYYEALKALRRFELLGEALEDSYSDEVIIRCEVAAGDIRAVLKCLYPNEQK